MSPRASVLIPIHNKPSTLPLTVDTVLRQSLADLEVILIGDGVTDPVRDVVGELTRADERVQFLDFPKGPHHGERYRHDAILAARSDAIFYLCDDDLLLPDHVADLVALLAEHTFVQSLNGYVTPAGHVRFYAADLADPATIALHLDDVVRFCSVSITGSAHTRASYDEVGDRWATTPAGWWPDHHQFRKLMRHPSFRGATSARMTALQFPTSSDGRDMWSDAERLAELEPWHRLVTAEGAQDEVDRRCRVGAIEHLAQDRETIARLQHDLAWLRGEHARQGEELAWVWEQYEIHRGHLTWLEQQHADQSATLAGVSDQLTRKRARVAELRTELRALRDERRRRPS
ncbi:MAG: glycosyltransferase [Nocardioides sp.]